MADNGGAFGRIAVYVIGGVILAAILGVGSGVVVRSKTCAGYQEDLGQGQREAACNSVTDPGYYWRIGERRSPYGYSGVKAAPDPQPRCSAATLGTSGQTVFVPAQGTTDPVAPWPVMVKYCRNKVDANNQPLSTFVCDPSTTDEGRENNGAPDPDSGIFLSTCAAIPKLRWPF